MVGLLSLLSAASLLPAVPACRIRPEGGARKPFQSPLLLVPVCCLVVRLVLTYRVVSVDPSLTDYYTELLAVVFLALAFYRLSSFAFRAGRTRRFAVYAALAIAFCLATLADRPDRPGCCSTWAARDAFRLPAPADGGTGRALGQYLTVYHKIPAAGSARRGDFPFVHKYRGNRETDQPFGWSVSLFLEDWMKRSFVSCKY